MNKRMRELKELIEQKTAEARGFMGGENKDVEKATAILKEVEDLNKELEAEAKLFELEKTENAPKEGEVKQIQEADSMKAFGRAAKAMFKTNDYDGTMNETVSADGGYTVPQDIVTRIQTYRDAVFSFLSLVRKETVKTKSGSRTFKKRSQHTGFNKVGEASKIGAINTPQFETVSYSIDKYAGYLPVTNELLADSDANVAQVIVEWFGEESRVTANKLILAVIESKGAPVNLENLDGIKKALNVTLGAAFKATSKIVTNDDGLQYLDTLKDENGRDLLSPCPNEPKKVQICAGATVIPVEVIPNADMASTPTYSASADTSVQAGKTYYTRTGSGTAQSPYVYTAVAEPTGNPSTSSYYEMDPTPMIPFIIGDLKEGVYFWDRQQLSMMQSNVAAIGELNAFEQDLTVYRGIEREDVTLRDAEAFVYGYIQPTVPSGE